MMGGAGSHLDDSQKSPAPGVGCHGDPRHLYLRGWIGRGSRKGADRRSRGIRGGVPKSWGYSPNHPSHGWPWLSIETNVDLGIPIFKKHPFWGRWVKMPFLVVLFFEAVSFWYVLRSAMFPAGEVAFIWHGKIGSRWKKYSDFVEVGMTWFFLSLLGFGVC